MRLISSVIAATLASTMAFAADLPSRKSEPYYAPAPLFTWTGFYVGVSIGAIGSQAKDNGLWENNGKPILAGRSITNPFGDVLPPYERKATGAGLLAGVKLGYNMQMGAMVLGLEVDASGVAMSNSQGSSPNYNALFGGGGGILGSCIANCLGQTFTSQWEGLATERLRLGYLVTPQWLIYATGGAAESMIHDRFQSLLVTADSSKWRIGWVAGGGVEYMITPGLSVNAEALYVSLGSQSYLTPFINNNGIIRNPIQLAVQNRYTDHAWVGRIGLAAHF